MTEVNTQQLFDCHSQWHGNAVLEKAQTLLRPIHTTGTCVHSPFLTPVFKGREHGCYFCHLCSQPMFTGAGTHYRFHGPWTRMLFLSPVFTAHVHRRRYTLPVFMGREHSVIFVKTPVFTAREHWCLFVTGTHYPCSQPVNTGSVTVNRPLTTAIDNGKSSSVCQSGQYSRWKPFQYGRICSKLKT